MDKLAAVNNIGQDFFGGAHITTQAGGLSKLITTIISNVLVLAGIVLIFIILYSGFSMVTGAGDAQAYERSRNTLTAGIIGFIIVVASWFIVGIVQTSTGVNLNIVK